MTALTLFFFIFSLYLQQLAISMKYYCIERDINMLSILQSKFQSNFLFHFKLSED